MLQEASNVRAFADFPWLLSPAAAMFLFVLGSELCWHPATRMVSSRHRTVVYN